MKISLWTIGETKSSHYRAIIADYNNRLKHYLKYEYREISTPAKGSPEKIMEIEKDRITRLLNERDRLVLWDVNSRQVTSEKFAGFIDNQLMDGIDIVFLIGGAYGFHPVLKNRAYRSFSLSKMTFNHQMVRIIALEQLYRAMTILRNEPYHNG